MTHITDLYLRTDTEADILAAFESAGIPYRSTVETTVDVIGTIYEQTGTTTDDGGNEIPVYEAVPGWHVNVYTRDPAVPEALSGVTITTPTTPKRVRAGA